MKYGVSLLIICFLSCTAEAQNNYTNKHTIRINKNTGSSFAEFPCGDFIVSLPLDFIVKDHNTEDSLKIVRVFNEHNDTDFELAVYQITQFFIDTLKYEKFSADVYEFFISGMVKIYSVKEGKYLRKIRLYVDKSDINEFEYIVHFASIKNTQIFYTTRYKPFIGCPKF